MQNAAEVRLLLLFVVEYAHEVFDLMDKLQGVAYPAAPTALAGHPAARNLSNYLGAEAI